MSCRLEILAAVVVPLIASTALGATTVTACGTDTASGGVNLAAALAKGGDIAIRCAGGVNEIRLTAVRTLAVATTIDGGDVTLIGPGTGAMFALPVPQPLSLRNLSLKNPPANPADPKLFTGIVYDETDKVAVELTNVKVSDTRLPFAVRRLVARNSSFIANGDANNPDLGVVMAGDLELESVLFRDNLSRPFRTLWREGLNAMNLKISARVINSIFERNRRPASWFSGDLVIGGSQFIGNGSDTPYTPGENGPDYYGGQVFFHIGSFSSGGAVEIYFGRAIISRSTFKGNRGMLGGAVLAWASSLTLQSSEFDDNQAVSAGAVAYISPAGDQPSLGGPLGFRLAHLKLRGNVAAKDGGAVLVVGDVSGESVLLSGNKAGESGGAIAIVGPGISPDEAVSNDVVEALPLLGSRQSTLALSRTFVLDNTAAQDAIAAGAGVLRLGNALVARNVASSAGGAAIHGQNVELANSTVINNKSEGVRIEPGGTHGARLSNTIISGNSANCTGSLADFTFMGANLQFPGAACGSAVTTSEPSLDTRFAPTLTSPARTTGTLGTCAGNDLVDGIDLYGAARGPSSCSIGAVDADLQRDVIRKVGEKNVPWLLFAILLLLLSSLILGLLLGARHRRRRFSTQRQ